MKALRDAKLEDGELTISRTVDATDSLSLIESARASIETLLAANARSDAAVGHVAERHDVAQSGDPHLRSMVQVLGYATHALDGHIGHLEDFAVDGEAWQIDYCGFGGYYHGWR